MEIAREAELHFARSASVKAIKSERGMEVLLDAAFYGFDDVVETLLNRGANANSELGTAATPLLFAIYGNRKSTVSLLLTRGADPNSKDEDSLPALLHAARGAQGVIAMLLVAHGADANAADSENGDTVLLLALRANNLELVRALLAKGAKPDTANKQGLTPLTYARTNNNAPAVDLLSKAGAIQ